MENGVKASGPLFEEMGMHPVFKSPEVKIGTKYRFKCYSEHLPEYVVNSVQCDFFQKTLTFNLLEMIPKSGSLPVSYTWAKNMLAWEYPHEEIVLLTVDGCGRHINKTTFSGLTPIRHEVTYGYDETGVTMHLVTVSYDHQDHDEKWFLSSGAVTVPVVFLNWPRVKHVGGTNTKLNFLNGTFDMAGRFEAIKEDIQIGLSKNNMAVMLQSGMTSLTVELTRSTGGNRNCGTIIARDVDLCSATQNDYGGFVLNLPNHTFKNK